jgi:hypothetical protein
MICSLEFKPENLGQQKLIKVFLPREQNWLEQQNVQCSIVQA